MSFVYIYIMQINKQFNFVFRLRNSIRVFLRRCLQQDMQGLKDYSLDLTVNSLDFLPNNSMQVIQIHKYLAMRDLKYSWDSRAPIRNTRKVIEWERFLEFRMSYLYCGLVGE